MSEKKEENNNSNIRNNNNNKDNIDNNKEHKFINNINEAKKHFETLYFDQLTLLALNKCLEANSDFCRSFSYDTEHAQAELIDFSNKHIEACFDKIFAFHNIYDEELKNLNKI